jgi:hypothetical protein
MGIPKDILRPKKVKMIFLSKERDGVTHRGHLFLSHKIHFTITFCKVCIGTISIIFKLL